MTTVPVSCPATILFVCAHNAGRSQLAAGLAAHAAARSRQPLAVASAGTSPEHQVSDVVLASLAEIGVDRSDQTPQLLTEELVRRADIVIALKPGLPIPHILGTRYEIWPLPDPAGWDVDGIRPLRAHLADRITDLLGALATDEEAAEDEHATTG